jgi:hypothetical protein
MSLVRFSLLEITYPSYGPADPPAPPELAEWQARLERARQRMERAGFTHLVVYGDREHFANLAYLTNLDPRFEEALLILSAAESPLLVTGLEGQVYRQISPLYRAGLLRSACYPPFSVQDAPSGPYPALAEICAAEGIAPGARVGCVGWKTYRDPAEADAGRAIDLPAYIVDALRGLCGPGNLRSATGLFINPADGLRATCSAAEIAAFEYANVLASGGLKQLLFGLADGQSDFAAARRLAYCGLPLVCHFALAFGANAANGLASPSGAVMRRGDPLTVNFGYWGSNLCRAGWLASGPQDLPTAAQDYAEAFAGPYFAALGEWLAGLRIGASCGELTRRLLARLPAEQYGIGLNPGHLIHLEEWLSSPFTVDSTIPLRSGMLIQTDVIPSSPVYYSTRMEEGYALADEALQAELAERYPAVLARCQARQRFLRETIGIPIGDELLPLADLAGLMPPYLLEPQLVFTLGKLI